ncbi:hypothetical protein BU17DRAFT_93986 [Hysterangium stoloniferum]|nr:hypothetical protein BU17DRAFT_93986 [Hysterangium stoloniferum]
MASPEPAPSLCMSLSSPIHLPSKEPMEVDVLNEYLIKELAQMSEKTPPTTQIHNDVLDLPPPSTLPIPEVATTPTSWI